VYGTALRNTAPCRRMQQRKHSCRRVCD